MENFITQAHSGIRWLVVLMTIVAFIYLLWGMLQSRPYDKRTHQVMVVWSSLVGVQWLIGIILFLVLGAFDVGYRWEHFVTMTIALTVAHLYMPFKSRPDALRYRAGLAVIIGVMILVFVGVARLPQGWTG
ncbi:MAG: hypothetical protein RLP44_07035 [Aggregatilineales bacterium]